MAIKARDRDASSTSLSASWQAASRASWWNRSSHEYAESPSSGNTASTACASAACCIAAMVSVALNRGSATRTRGTPTATRIRS